VFFHDSHPFEDDTDFAVSRYRYWVNVEDSARDQQRQLAIAQRVFDAVKARGLAGDALFRPPGQPRRLPVKRSLADGVRPDAQRQRSRSRGRLA
jgi:hypothetical protein